MTQATTVTPATSNIKDDSNIMTFHNSRNASNSRNESSTVWTPSKAGMLAKRVKPATAWREANSSRDNGNIKASTAEGRPQTTRMPEIVETSQQQYTSISRDANSTKTPTANSQQPTPKTREFSQKFAVKSSEQ
jgi:hypothetical protein